jgi:SAM-dependent methyltransferase
VNTPEFPRRDPADADFWDLRYSASFSPWDAGKVPRQLRAFADAFAGERRALVPGCGSGHDVRYLAERGWDVLGIDFSAAALEAARPVLGPYAHHLRQADFFADLGVPAFPFIYERAFLCALPRRRWPDWGARMAELVAPNACLAGYFYFDAGERGPPFPLRSQAELDALIDGAFERVDDAAVPDSIPVFAGKERWQVWRRRAA